MRSVCAALLLIAGIGTAAADIRIDQSHYIDGKLTVAGRTEPNQTVVLDGKYKTKSNAQGDFKFTEHYKPATCMGEIRSGGSEYGAVISGCFDPGDTMSIDKLPPAGSPEAPMVKKLTGRPKR